MKLLPIKDVSNKSVTVMGLGRFGGGVGVVRYLVEKNARVTVTDLKTEGELAASLEQLRGCGIRFVLGRHELKDFIDTDMVVVNPAVPRDSQYITAARKHRVPLVTEIGLFVSRCPAPVCGVTGSNGKTTTVAMIRSILEQSERTFWVGGNIGGSLLEPVDTMSPGDLVVLELSSFQLEWLAEMRWSPRVAAILNITPNHLDRHGSFAAYRAAKIAILEHQYATDTAILVRDDPENRALTNRVRSHIRWVGTDLDVNGITLDRGWIVDRTLRKTTRIFDIHRFVVPGAHNRTNAMTAAACAMALGITSLPIVEGLASFRGLPHRLEFIGEHLAVRFYNDSKATTPESTIAGIYAFECPVIPILGGYDKGVSFDNMAGSIAANVPWAAVFGQTAGVISQALEKAGIPNTFYGTLEEAFSGCLSRARDGDIVLLSPACASYDMFSDYEERGEAFRALVQAHISSETSPEA